MLLPSSFPFPCILDISWEHTILRISAMLPNAYFFLSACALKCKWSKCSLCEALPHSRFLGASLNQLSTQSRLKGGAMSTPQELFHKVGTITNTCNKSVCSLRFFISLIAQGKISMILNVTKRLQGRKSIRIHTISAKKSYSESWRKKGTTQARQMFKTSCRWSKGLWHCRFHP